MIEKRPWSDSSKRILIETYKSESAKEISIKLKRSESAIHQEAMILGLKKEKVNHNYKSPFIIFCFEQLEKKKVFLAKESYYTYKAYIGKINSFNDKVDFNDITEDFIYQYREWMLSKGNNESTASKSLQVLRTFVNLAVRYEKIIKNPFQYVKIRTMKGKRDFLTKDEFNSLLKAYNGNIFKGIKRDVLRCFLISCTTGLRFSDMKLLKQDNIKEDMISVVMHKTGLPVSIPVNQRAKELLSGTWPKMYCNKVTNRMLKEICGRIGIEKKVTFHVARHTFATISITLGMPIEVVSKLLGHTDIKTTQIYAKVVDSVKIKEMAKWDA